MRCPLIPDRRILKVYFVENFLAHFVFFKGSFGKINRKMYQANYSNNGLQIEFTFPSRDMKNEQTKNRFQYLTEFADYLWG